MADLHVERRAVVDALVRIECADLARFAAALERRGASPGLGAGAVLHDQAVLAPAGLRWSRQTAGLTAPTLADVTASPRQAGESEQRKERRAHGLGLVRAVLHSQTSG